jgi:type IV pilus assembly protein PilC
LGGLGVVLLAAFVSLRQPAVRYRFDHFLITMPVLGPVNLMNEMSRFSQTMSLLVRAGLPLPSTMDMAQRTSGNRVVRESLSKVKHSLMEGKGLSGPMFEDKIFPRLLAQMVKVGEETGNLESTMGVVADHYETEANDKLNGLIAMIEPTMTIALGLAVAFIAVSVITPMYSLLSGFE